VAVHPEKPTCQYHFGIFLRQRKRVRSGGEELERAFYRLVRDPVGLIRAMKWVQQAIRLPLPRGSRVLLGSSGAAVNGVLWWFDITFRNA
jgi:hypothetical protein